ncbi:transglutaminase domain-containing protein [bacterium]|nr:transglutaminase domain-containing protein [bacterium]
MKELCLKFGGFCARYLFFNAFLLLLIVSFSFAGEFDDLREIIPDEDEEKVIENLEKAGDNAVELRRAIEYGADGIREGLCFMIANMAPSDLANVSEDFLINDVSLSYNVRDEFWWGSKYSDELFLHYVLPYRVSQEPVEAWRPYLYSQLKPVVKDLETMSEVAVEVNRWCGERVKFQQTQRQDQGVFETLRSGYGRCEEMMIVYVSALRAVGIPAREAWTPYWAHCDNNHAWTEVWADGDWHYTGSCEPKPSLDNAWFNVSARRAAIVLASAFGHIDENKTSDRLYKNRDHYGIINSTFNYRQPSKLTVVAEEESTHVWISVFNFGSLRPILHRYTDSDGLAAFYMGEGDFFVSAGKNGKSCWKVVELVQDQETRINLELSDDRIGEETFWLRYKPSEAYKVD